MSIESKLAEQAGHLYSLFTGNQRSIGQWNPKTGKAYQLSRGPTVEDFLSHVKGQTGMGIVPIQDDGTCWWGAIDIDNHGEDEDLPIAGIDAIIQANKLPLVACRSKSGGVHVFLFGSIPLPAARVRSSLLKWAVLLGYAKSEVFPKQTGFPKNKDGTWRGLGNWLNLPYFAGETTNRHAVRNGRKLTLPQFITLAENSRIDGLALNNLLLLDHPEAPPCVQRMMTDGVATGRRNEALYQVSIYLKKRDPDSVMEWAKDLNGVMFDRPIPSSEFIRTVNSATRPDCQYKCGEEPAHSYCDRDVCITRKFGISKGEFDSLTATADLPAFTELVKFQSEPTRWELKIDGQRITNILTDELMDFRFIRKVVAERLVRVVPMLKPAEWDRLLAELMKSHRLVETPEDASVNGLIRARLREFAGRTDLMNRGEVADDRKALLRGLPVVQLLDGERQVCFRAQDFVNYLKRTKAEELKGVNLWFAIRDLGVMHNKMRVGSANINVWYLPVNEVYTEGGVPEAPKFKSKI